MRSKLSYLLSVSVLLFRRGSNFVLYSGVQSSVYVVCSSEIYIEFCVIHTTVTTVGRSTLLCYVGQICKISKTMFGAPT